MAGSLLNSKLLRRLEQLVLISRKTAAGKEQGERHSRRHGAGNEFIDYRNYVPGDDLRYLDWKIYGRLDRLFIRLFREELDLRITILLDVSRSMRFGEPEKLEYAKCVAAAIGYLGLAGMDSVEVLAFDQKITSVFGPKRGKGNGIRLFQFLDRLADGDEGGTALYPSFNAAVQRGGTRGGLVVVLSDLYDFNGYQEAFRRLFAHNRDVLMIHLFSPQELKPDFSGDLQLEDCEYGMPADLSFSPSVLRAYEAALIRFRSEAEQYIRSRGGSYISTSTALPFERLVLDLLCRQGVLR